MATIGNIKSIKLSSTGGFSTPTQSSSISSTGGFSTPTKQTTSTQPTQQQTTSVQTTTPTQSHSGSTTGVSVVSTDTPITDVKSGLQLTSGQGVVNIGGGTAGGGTSVRTYFTPGSSSGGFGALSGGIQEAQRRAFVQESTPTYSGSTDREEVISRPNQSISPFSTTRPTFLPDMKFPGGATTGEAGAVSGAKQLGRGVLTGATVLGTFGVGLVTNPIQTGKETAIGLFNVARHPIRFVSREAVSFSTNPLGFLGEQVPYLLIGAGAGKVAKSARIAELGELKITDIRAGYGTTLSQEGKSIIFEQQQIKYSLGNLFKREKVVNVRGVTTAKEIRPGVSLEATGVEYVFGKWGRPRKGAALSQTTTTPSGFSTIGKQYFQQGKKTIEFPFASKTIQTSEDQGLRQLSTITAVATNKMKPTYLIASRTKEIVRERTPSGEKISFLSFGAGINPAAMNVRKSAFEFFKLPKIPRMKEIPSEKITPIDTGKLMTGALAKPQRSALQSSYPRILEVGYAKEVARISKTTPKIIPLVTPRSKTRASTTISQELKSTSNLLKSTGLAQTPKLSARSDVFGVTRIGTKQGAMISQAPMFLSITGGMGVPNVPSLPPPPTPFGFSPGFFGFEGRGKQPYTKGSLFSKYTPSVRGIELGIVSSRSLKQLSQQMFVGTEIRGLVFPKITKRRRR